MTDADRSQILGGMSRTDLTRWYPTAAGWSYESEAKQTLAALVRQVLGESDFLHVPTYSSEQELRAADRRLASMRIGIEAAQAEAQEAFARVVQP